MERIEGLITSLKALAERLDAPELEPDPQRKDWDRVRDVLAELSRTAERDLLGAVDGACRELDDAQEVEAVRGYVAMHAAEVGALLHASGDASGLSLARRAATVAPAGELRTELEAGGAHPEAWLQLVHGRWLLRTGREGRGEKILRRLAGSAPDPVLGAAARASADAPRPLKSGAPGLWRINGFGVGLYGRRDQQPDGTYVATTCISALFIPVLPLKAWRVRDEGNGSYTFFAREQLSGFARIWRRLVLTGAAAAVLFALISGWLNSPGHRFELALEEARRVEQSGDAAAALAAYERLVHDYEGSVDAARLQEAGASVLRLSADEVERPLSLERLESAQRVVRRYEALPAGARGGAAAAALARHVEDWASQLGTEEPAAHEAAIRLLEQALPLSEGDDRQRLEKRLTTTRRALAEALTPEWPIEALKLYVRNSAADLEAARAIIDGLGPEPSLWLEAAEPIDLYLTRADNAGVPEEALSEVRSGLEKARALAEDPERRALLEGGEAAALERWLSGHPGDQDVTAGLARAEQLDGRPEDAERRLEALGPPGRLVGEAQRTLASVWADQGRLEEADDLLTRYVSSRLPDYRQKRRAWTEAFRNRHQGLVSDLERGRIPAELRRELQAADEAGQAELIDNWLSERIEADQGLTRLRGAFEQASVVVPASLELGLLKLRRARSAEPDQRAALLARAESAFTAIRDDAEGLPAYHLGLGQVLHWLGRHDEGEQELAKVLALGQPALELAVARSYRELGLMARAREVAKAVYDQAPSSAEGSEAAILLALTESDDAAAEAWFRKADGTSPFVRANLLRLSAGRLYREGRLADADRKFAEVAALFARDAAHDSSAANNLAIVLGQRFRCTGKPAHLAEASRQMARALRLQPESALVVGNYADALGYEARIDVLSRWFRVKLLLPAEAEAEELVEALGRGPHRAQLLAALRGHPAWRKSLDLTAQEELLAPGRIGPWRRQADWLDLTRDAEALAELDTRLAGVAALDTSREEAAMRSFETSERDEALLGDLAGSLARLDRAVAAAEKAHDAPSLAAALLLRSRLLAERAGLSGDLADAEAAVESLRRADAAWDGLDLRDELAWALVNLGVLRLNTRVPEVKEAWKDSFRRLGPVLFVHRMAKGGSEAVVGAVRAEPAFREAARLRLASLEGRPLLEDWLLGEVTADETLREAARAVFDLPQRRLTARIGARLAPHSEARRLRAELLSRNLKN